MIVAFEQGTPGECNGEHFGQRKSWLEALTVGESSDLADIRN